MNIKEIKASKAQGHKRTEDAKTTEKPTKKPKRVHLKLFIDGHLLAEQRGHTWPLQSLPVSLGPSISFFFFFSSSLSSFLPFSLNTNVHCSSCCCDYTLPLLVRTPSTSWASAESLYGPWALPPTKLCLPFALSLGVPSILLMDGLKISVTSVKVTGTQVNIGSHQSPRPAHGRRGVSIVYLTACYLFTRKNNPRPSLCRCDPETKGWHSLLPPDTQACATCSETSRTSSDDNGLPWVNLVPSIGLMYVLSERNLPLPLSAQQRHSRLGNFPGATHWPFLDSRAAVMTYLKLPGEEGTGCRGLLLYP